MTIQDNGVAGTILEDACEAQTCNTVKLDAVKANVDTGPSPSPSPSPSPTPPSPSPSTSGDAVSAAGVMTATTNTITIKANENTYTGTSANDLFSGMQYFNEASGSYVTMNPSNWIIDGKGGDDVLKMEIAASATPSSVINVEEVVVKATAASTLDMAGFANVSKLGNFQSTAALTVTGVPNALTHVTMQDVNNQAFSVSIAAAKLAGSEDAITVNIHDVSDAGAADITLQPNTAGSGYETVTLHSEGGSANKINQFTDGNGDSLATVKFTGDQKLTIAAALDSTVTTLDASKMTAGGVVLSGALPAAVTTVTGSPADDTFTFGANLATTDTVDGGEGTDTLSVTAAVADDATAQLTAISNTEVLEVSDNVGAVTINADYWSADFNKVTFLGEANGATLKVKAGQANTVSIGKSGTANTDLGGALTVSPRTDGTNDSLVVDIYGHTANRDLTLSEFENVTINSNQAANTVDSVQLAAAAGTQKLTVKGAKSLTVTGAITADEIDASGMTVSTTANGLVMQDAAHTAETLTGSDGKDTLYGSTSADTISGGKGADTLYNQPSGNGPTAGDIMTGGEGYDKFALYGAVATPSGYTGASRVTDFTVGTTTTNTDILQLSAGVANYDGVDAFAAGVAAAAAGSTAVQTVAKNAAAVAYVGTADLVKLTTSTAFDTDVQTTFNNAIGTATVTGFNVGGTDDIFVTMHDSTNNRMVIMAVDVSGTTTNTILETGDTVNLIGTINMSATDYANFDKDNLEIIA